jgi:hypothetical protein
MSSFQHGLAASIVLSVTACGGRFVEVGFGAPRVIATSPSDGATNAAVNPKVTATFNEPMDPATIDGSSFTLHQGADAISSFVTYAAATQQATLEPLIPLEPSTAYTATLIASSRDAQGNPLTVDFVWSFTTGPCSQAPVRLVSATHFAILGGSSVSNAGPSTVTGDLGAGTAVNGFPPGTLVGFLHVGDPTAGRGRAELASAYQDAAGRTLCQSRVSEELGGSTLTPGLYTSASSLAVSSGDLTLDALGDPQAVFIFQAAAMLTLSAGRRILLSGGASAANVYWQVGDSATLEAATAFQGTVLAAQSITLQAGATLNGRALAQAGTVTLENNTVEAALP